MTSSDMISLAKKTIAQEAEAVAAIADLLTEDLGKVIDVIINCKGRVVISGIGKSAIIAQKIVATLNSTGTPSLFMHAADAIHGDIGMMQQNDVVMIVSKSGDSPEIKLLIPIVRNFGNEIVAIVGNINSFLARNADFILDTTVDQEACPNNLAPTTSTTAQMVMGDALAICLMSARGFNAEEFAKFHPGGTLGKKLYLKVADLSMQNQRPAVNTECLLKDVIVEITNKRLGATAVLDDNNKIAGIITDGDLRRMLEKSTSLNEIKAKDIMMKDPKTIDAGCLAVEALDNMRKNNITQLLVTENENYAGVIHLHDLIREGII